jgi:hypothetical protein
LSIEKNILFQVKSFVRPVGQEVAMSIAVVIQFRRLAAAAALALGLAMPASANDAMPLVSTQWLKSNLSDPAIVVLDIRSAIDGGGAEAFAKAHIPGAVHSDYDKGGWSPATACRSCCRPRPSLKS